MIKKNISEYFVAPGDFIGILGGGQLGRILAITAKRLGIKTIIYSDIDTCPARPFADEFLCGSYYDADLLDDFSRKASVITYEFENIPHNVTDYLETRANLLPGSAILAITQDRLAERAFLSSINIPCARYNAVSYEGNIKNFLNDVSEKAILKVRRSGYDGKGQVIIENPKNAVMAYYDIKEAPALIEEFINFKSEFSVIAIRSHDGQFYHYDICDNIHEDGILKSSTVPSQLSTKLQKQAIDYTQKIADSLGYIGVFAVEFFVTKEDTLLVNEIAPRVHNSGHWTIDACRFDQFENHIRAICGWPIGDLKRHSDAIMLNLLGDDVNNWQSLLADHKTTMHLYGKEELREGRKMGHVTTLK